MNKQNKYVPVYICNKCDILLADGPEYTWCPKCKGKVDIMDMSKDIYACPKCEYLINKILPKKEARKLYCKKCKNIKLRKVPGTGMEVASWKQKKTREYLSDRLTFDFLTFILPSGSILLISFIFVIFVDNSISVILKFMFSFALIFFFVPLILIMLSGFVVTAIEIFSTLDFVIMLFLKKRKKLIINHGIEHATINVLLDHNLPVFGGQSDSDGFRINTPINAINVGMAFIEAVRRISGGEKALTVSPRCGTTVGIIGLIYIASIITSLWLWQSKFLTLTEAYGILILLFFIFYFLKYPLSITMQRVVTVSSIFTKASIKEIKQVDTERDELVKTYYVSTDINL
ncbi:MAG: hypothetical protein FJZ16_01290 [Candidatus Omnitrophica bacterium]|nr:hypothetical protein [Candidatus Omnitrophota bacterium]